MLDALILGFQVIRRPNSAFATLRDNDGQYFLPSVGVMLLASIVLAGVDSSIPLDIEQQQTPHVAASFGLSVLATVITAGTIYLIGRVLGGNKSWRKALTVLFYTNIIWIPVAAVLYLIPYVNSDGVAAVTPLALFAWAIVTSLALSIWAIIVTIKAVKTLNGFGTGKAFGIMVLAWIVQILWFIPILLLYLPMSPFQMPAI